MEQLIAIVNEVGIVKSSVLGILLVILFGSTIVNAVKTLSGKNEASPQNPVVRTIGNVFFAVIATFLIMTVLGSLNEGLGFMALFGSPIIFGVILFVVFKAQEKKSGL